MRKARVLLVISIWLAILPYLGFPYSWKGVLTTLTGLGLVYFSYTIYLEHKVKKERSKGVSPVEEETFDNFRENNFSLEEEI